MSAGSISRKGMVWLTTVTFAGSVLGGAVWSALTGDHAALAQLGGFAVYVNDQNNVGVGTNAPKGVLNATGQSTNPSGGSCPAGYDWYDENGNGNPDNGECKRTLLLATSTGNVGIGTTSPSNALNVNGGIDILNLLRHQGDTDTSIGFPGNDQIGLSTNGSTRMTVTSTGSIGVATTSPGNTLDVNGGIDVLNSVRHRGDTDTSIGFPGNDQIGLSTNGSTRMTVTSTGSIGVATTSPGNTLDVNGGIDVLNSVRHRGDTDTSIGFPDNDQIGLSTNGSTRVTVAPSGNVGIGTTSPSYKLHAYADDGTYEVATVQQHGTGGAMTRYIDNTGYFTAFGSENGKASIRTDNTPRMTIDLSGNVGIGTTNPSNKLNVNGGVDIYDYLRHQGDTNTSIGFPANDQIAMTTNGSRRMTITSSGSVGIGTTSPGATLDVAGNITASGGLTYGTSSTASSAYVTAPSTAALETSSSRYDFCYLSQYYVSGVDDSDSDYGQCQVYKSSTSPYYWYLNAQKGGKTNTVRCQAICVRLGRN